jgi:hypothetical protein
MSPERGLALMLALACALAGCAPPPAAEVPPTSVLIPATATPTATPAPPTTTPETLTSPEDLNAAALTPAGVQAAQGADLLSTDPVAQSLVSVASRELAGRRGLALRRIDLVSVEAIIWPDASLGCPQPGASYAPGPIDGYRIVLEAGSEQTIYHTDFDRVFVCRAQDEVLPAQAEATVEAG